MAKFTNQGRDKGLLDVWNDVNTRRNTLLAEVQYLDFLLRLIERRNDMDPHESISS